MEKQYHSRVHGKAKNQLAKQLKLTQQKQMKRSNTIELCGKTEQISGPIRTQHEARKYRPQPIAINTETEPRR